MQKTIKIGTIIYLCFMCFAATAQKDKEEKSAIEEKNAIKINLAALALKNISLGYERAVGKRTSVALNVHTIPFGTLPFQSTFKKLLDNSSVKYDQFKLGTLGVIPEFRYYVGKKGVMRGFYIAPFLNYNSYKMEFPIVYSNKTAIFNGKINSVTGGLQLGTQFRLGKNVVLDWWIFGPNYGSANGTLTFTAGTALTQQEKAELQTQLDQLKEDVPLNTIKTAVATNNGAIITAKGPWAGLRGLGFNLGFRF